jgi:hypothetical protein
MDGKRREGGKEKKSIREAHRAMSIFDNFFLSISYILNFLQEVRVRFRQQGRGDRDR